MLNFLIKKIKKLLTSIFKFRNCLRNFKNRVVVFIKDGIAQIKGLFSVSSLISSFNRFKCLLGRFTFGDDFKNRDEKFKNKCYKIKNFISLCFKPRNSNEVRNGIVLYSFYNYQKYYVSSLYTLYNPVRFIGGWISKRVVINRASLKYNENYLNILPFKNPEKFSIKYHNKPVIYFGNYLQLFQFVGNLWFRYTNHRLINDSGDIWERTQIFKNLYTLDNLPYFAKIDTFMCNFFYPFLDLELEEEDSVLNGLFPVSQYRNRNFDLKFTSKEEILVFIDLLIFIKWELKIGGLFANQNIAYNNYVPEKNVFLPFWDSKYDHLRNCPDDNVFQPGHYFHEPTITNINELLAFLYYLKNVNKFHSFSDSYNHFFFSIERLKTKIKLFKIHFQTFKIVLKNNLKLSTKFITLKIIIIFILAKCNKFFIYPLFFILTLKRKKNDWKVKFGTWKGCFYNLKENIKNPSYFNKIKFLDKLKVVLFSVIVSLPLRAILYYFGINKSYTWEDAKNKWLEDRFDATVMYMKQASSKIHRPVGQNLTFVSTVVSHKEIRENGAEAVQPYQNLLRVAVNNPRYANNHFNTVDDSQELFKEAERCKDKSTKGWFSHFLNNSKFGRVISTYPENHGISELPERHETGVALMPHIPVYPSSSIYEQLASSTLISEQAGIVGPNGIFELIRQIQQVQSGEFFALISEKERLKYSGGNACPNDDAKIVTANHTIFIQIKAVSSLEAAVKFFPKGAFISQDGKVMRFTIFDVSSMPVDQRFSSSQLFDEVARQKGMKNPHRFCLTNRQGMCMPTIDRRGLKGTVNSSFLANHAYVNYEEQLRVLEQRHNREVSNIVRQFKDYNHPTVNKPVMETDAAKQLVQKLEKEKVNY